MRNLLACFPNGLFNKNVLFVFPFFLYLVKPRNTAPDDKKTVDVLWGRLVDVSKKFQVFNDLLPYCALE